MKYPIAERFVAPQGEGLYTGTPMAFIRLVGCSVSQKVCTACDTDYLHMDPAKGGGLFEPDDLAAWVQSTGVRRACLTGGEPCDRDLRLLIGTLLEVGVKSHLETSGTVFPDWLRLQRPAWVCVSPKPGYLMRMLLQADEIKVILGGLGDGPGWPTLEDAVRWADEDKLVYVQPRNGRTAIDAAHMAEAVKAVVDHPKLRLSAQLHKYIGTR